MATYQSVSSVGINDGVPTNIVIPKPSGLAVGDLMVAGVRAFVTASAITITAPAGWTTEETTTITSGAYPTQRLTVFTKIADSADVAASDFTFTNSVGSSIHGGIIVRASLSGLTNAGESSATIQTSGASTTLTGFTPSRANCLFVFFGTQGENVTGTANISAVSLATNNPTWTRRAQVTLNGANRFHALACFTATRPETTATGTITFNFATSSNALTNGIMLAISPQVNGSYNAEDTKLNIYAHTWIQSADLYVNADNPATSSFKPTTWTPIDKS